MVCTDSSSTSFCQDKGQYIQCMCLWIKSSTSLVVLKYPLHLYHTQTNLQPAHYTGTRMIREDKSKNLKYYLYSLFLYAGGCNINLISAQEKIVQLYVQKHNVHHNICRISSVCCWNNYTGIASKIDKHDPFICDILSSSLTLVWWWFPLQCLWPNQQCRTTCMGQ